MVQPPHCSRDNPLKNNGCGNRYEAYCFFISFVLLGQLCVLNLFMAVVLERYVDNRRWRPLCVFTAPPLGLRRSERALATPALISTPLIAPRR